MSSFLCYERCSEHAVSSCTGAAVREPVAISAVALWHTQTRLILGTECGRVFVAPHDPQDLGDVWHDDGPVSAIQVCAATVRSDATALVTSVSAHRICVASCRELQCAASGRPALVLLVSIDHPLSQAPLRTAGACPRWFRTSRTRTAVRNQRGHAPEQAALVGCGTSSSRRSCPQRVVLAGTADGTLLFHRKLTFRTTTAVLAREEDQISALHWSADGNIVAYLMRGRGRGGGPPPFPGGVKVLNPTTFQKIGFLPFPPCPRPAGWFPESEEAPGASLQFTADNRILAVWEQWREGASEGVAGAVAGREVGGAAGAEEGVLVDRESHESTAECVLAVFGLTRSVVGGEAIFKLEQHML